MDRRDPGATSGEEEEEDDAPGGIPDTQQPAVDTGQGRCLLRRGRRVRLMSSWGWKRLGLKRTPVNRSLGGGERVIP